MQHHTLLRTTRRAGRLQASSASRRQIVPVCAIHTDCAARVKGHVRHVYNFVANYENLQLWNPGVTRVTVTRGAGQPLNLRHQYQAEHNISGLKVNTLYEVVDMHQDKKVVYSLGSELHSATEQLIFMPDPNDPTFTVVRFMSNVELTEWRRALQPIVSGVLRSMPEQALGALTSLLNSSKSPIINQASPRGKAAGNSTGGWSFNKILNNLRSEADGFGGGAKQATAIKAEPQVDVLGYYATLGLDGARPANVSAADVRAAFRKAALLLHPDRQPLSLSELERLEAEEAFKKMQTAYTILRDPAQRKLYDAGKLLQAEESVM